MNIDLHCHAKLSKKNPFSLKHFFKLQQSALKSGLQAVALTEHFDTKNFGQIHECLQENFAYRDDYYEVDGLKVFCGLEVDIKEGGHITLIGKKDDILALQQKLISFVVSEGPLPFKILMEEANKRELIKIGAHPYRSQHPLGNLDAELLQQLDFLELNGKDYKKEDMVRKLAASLHMPVVAGSDTHHRFQVGCVLNRLNQDCVTISQLKDCLIKGDYETVISPKIGLKISSAKLAKKILKKFSYIMTAG